MTSRLRPDVSDADVCRVFVAHVEEDRAQAEAIVHRLRDSGLDVWWSQDSILSGRRWRQEIRQAIDSGGAFVACFSVSSERKYRSYMREELSQALEQLRLRRTDRAWFIPVLLSDPSDVDLRKFRISDLETLADLEYIEEGGDTIAIASRIVESIASETAPEAVARMQRRLSQAEAQASLAELQLEFAQGRAAAATLVASALSAAPRAQSTQIAETISVALRNVAALLSPSTLASGFGAGWLASNNVLVGGGDEPLLLWSNRDGVTFGARLRKHYVHWLPELPISAGQAPELILSRGESHLLTVPRAGEARAFEVPASGVSNWRVLPSRAESVEALEWHAPLRGPFFHWRGHLHRLTADDSGRVAESPVFSTRRTTSQDLPIEGVRDVAISNNGCLLVYLTIDTIGYATRDAYRGRWECRGEVPIWDGFSIDQGQLVISRTPTIGERLAVSDRGTFWLALRGMIWLGHLRDVTCGRTLNENDQLARIPGIRPMFIGEDGATVSFLSSQFDLEREVQDAFHLCAVDIPEENARWSGQTRRVLAMQPPRFRCLGQTWSPDRRWYASIDAEGTCVVTETSYTSRLPTTEATISWENAASDGTLLAYQAGDEVEVCALGGDLVPRKVASLGLPERFQVRKVLVSKRFVVVASEAADGRVSRQVWSFDGNDVARTVFTEVTSPIFDRRAAPSERIRVSVSRGVVICSWQHDDRQLRMVNLTTGDDMTVEVADGLRDLVWDLSPDGRKLATYGGYEHPVRVVDTESRRELVALRGTGAGIGRAWGGTPGDVAFIDDETVVVVKRAGTCSAWDLKSGSPIGRPVMTAEDASLDRILPLRPEGSERRFLVDAHGNCAWLVTRSAHGRSRVARLAGVSVVLGRQSEDVFLTATRAGELALLDLAHEARSQHLRSLAERSTDARGPQLASGLGL